MQHSRYPFNSLVILNYDYFSLSNSLHLVLLRQVDKSGIDGKFADGVVVERAVVPEAVVVVGLGIEAQVGQDDEVGVAVEIDQFVGVPHPREEDDNTRNIGVVTGNSKPSNGFLSDELYRFLVCVRHRREKKKRRSRDRLRKKRRHRSRSRSASESSRSRSRSRSSPNESRVSPITSAVRKLAAGNVTKQLLLQ